MCTKFDIILDFYLPCSQFRRTVLEIVDMLEEEDLDQLWIAPPATAEESDADSGDEDGGGLLDNLSGR